MLKEFEKFYSGFRSEVIELSNSDEGYPQKEQAFTYLVAEDLSQAGILESPDICYFENGSGNTLKKANGFSVPEEDTSLDIFISLYHGSNQPPTVNSQQVTAAFNQLGRFLKAAFSGFHNEVEPGSDEFQFLHQVHTVKEEIDRVRFFLLTDGKLSVRSEVRQKETVENLSVSYEIWDIERIYRFRSSGASHEPVVLDLRYLPEGGLTCADGGNGHLGYISKCAIIPGTVLADLYDEHGQRLLELNVRSYLQARGKVNQGILETLYESPERFLAYNNGITVVAEELKTGRLNNGSTGITEINGLQIVNGGQTTASIHRASKPEKMGKNKGRVADLAKVFVQAKITVIDRQQFDSMVPLISKFSNTQNKVTEVDLRANHPYHVGIERASRKIWVPGEKSKWFYERARGSYQTDKARFATTPARKRNFEEMYPSSQKIGLSDLAKYYNCWNCFPHIASRGGQKSFVYFMQRVGNVEEGWEPSEEEYRDLIGITILYKRAQKICRQLGRPGLQVHCCNYTVASLASRTARRIDLQAIWRKQDISDTLKSVIHEWAPAIMDEMIESAGEANQTEWFKKEKCWNVIEDMPLEITLSLEEELLSVHGSEDSGHRTGRNGNRRNQNLSSEDKNNIARCREVSSDGWHALAKWGKESGRLEDWQAGIANTMAGYALSGWPDGKPTKKQAKHSVKMLGLMKEHS